MNGRPSICEIVPVLPFLDEAASVVGVERKQPRL